MYQWNEEHQCLCDLMGLPVSLTEAKELIETIQTKHMTKSAVDLHGIHRHLMATLHPVMQDKVSKSVGSLR